MDLFPDTYHDEGVKPGLAGYLDEFLSAIKIFGYLERPVFHELTRSMQTRKLLAGETLNLEEEKGFCIVVDGLVEIFVKSSRDSRCSHAKHLNGMDALDSDEDETYSHGRQKYQLLTEVRNGAPMSSLFSIMSLFTEDVDIRRVEENDDAVVGPSGNISPPQAPRSADFVAPPESAASPDEPDASLETSEPEGVSMKASRKRISDVPDMPNLSTVPRLSLDGSNQKKRPRAPTRASSSVHPDIIGRATVDTTIAIIPASAFRRLIKSYPKATAHIVHVILSRFQRVTWATAYTYLGLTGVVLQTERSMTRHTTCQLPNMLRGEPLSRLKEKFKHERNQSGEEASKGIALHNAHSARPRRSKTGLRREAAFQAMVRQRATTSITPQSAGLPAEPASAPSNTAGARKGSLNSGSGTARPVQHLEIPRLQPWQVEDALTVDDPSPLSRRAHDPFASQRCMRISGDRFDSVDEDNLFRASILECMFKALGLGTSGTDSNEPASEEASPRLASLDQKRTRAGPTPGDNAFGFMEGLEWPADGETDSMTSVTMNQSLNAHALANDMKHEVEIVFFPKGSVLVEQGERSPGLYYVIDGFLDICSADEGSTTEIPTQLRRSASIFTSNHSLESLHRGRQRRSSSNFMGVDTLFAAADSKKKSGGKRSVCLIRPGGLAGYIGTVTSFRSFVEVVAKTDVYVGFLPRASLERIVDRHPIVLLTMAKRLTSFLPRLILHIDFALEWLQVNAGQVIFHKGDESEAIYLVLNGRLRQVEDKPDGHVRVQAEFGQGESVGELEVLTESPRVGTLHAIRDTELVKFPRTLFKSLALEHPNITIKISKIIATRMRLLMDDPARAVTKDESLNTYINHGPSTMNLRTVAVLPVAPGVPVVDFAHRLMTALAQVGSPNGATSLNQTAVLNHLGRHAFNKMGKLKLAQYLADLEEKYGMVVYVAGMCASTFPEANQHVISRCDITMSQTECRCH